MNVSFEIYKYNLSDGLFSHFNDAMTVCSIKSYEIRKSAIKHPLFNEFIESLDVVESFVEKQTESNSKGCK